MNLIRRLSHASACLGQLALVGLVCGFVSAGRSAEAQTSIGLPPAPAAIGQVYRDEDGHIVPRAPQAAPAPAAPATALSSAPSSGASPARPSAAPPRAAAPAAPHRAGVAMAMPAAVVKPHAAGEIVGLRVVNPQAGQQPATIATFGQVFAKGDLPKQATLAALANGQRLPLQMDVKTRYGDGSVRHAILDLAIPALGPRQAVDVMLSSWRGDGRGAALDMPADKIAPLVVTVTFRDGIDAGKEARVALRDLVADSRRWAVGPAWLSGPLAVERRFRKPLGAGLVAQFDVRLDKGGRSRVDVALTYDGAYSVPMRNLRYDVAISEDGRTLLRHDNLKHHHHGNWHHVIWSAPEPQPHIAFDAAYWMRAGAVPAFDTAIVISGQQIAEDAAALAKADTGPMGPALNTTYMPSTGQTDGENVGLISNWQAKYLLSQDSRARRVMLANADAAGSIPWHFRDERTGRPVTIDRHPGLRISENGPGEGRDALPAAFSPKNTGWTPDTAHMPSYSYLPYLLTGSHYYLDELQFQAAWVLAFYNPSFRGGAKGLIGTRNEEQVRGFAWSLRTLGDAAYATPDDDVLKGYFTAKLNNNLDRLVQRYVVDRAMRGAGAVEGWMEGDNRDQTEAAPWQQDFFAMSLRYLGQRGYPQADRMLLWMGNFLTGRFLSGPAGFAPSHGAAYEIKVMDRRRRPFATWAEVFNATFDRAKPPSKGDLGYPDDPGGYAAAARGALAGLIAAGGGPRARDAYGVVCRDVLSPRAIAGFSRMPKWAIASSLPGEALCAGGRSTR